MVNRALSDGTVSKLIGTAAVPKFYKIRQKFDNNCITDIPAEITSTLSRPGTLDMIKSGQNISIAVGSRGISNLAEIVRCVVDNVKSKNASPFIITSMGSHGGATSEGQKQLLADYGVTETAMGCPVISSMETICLGRNEYGVDAFYDKSAYDSDGVILINRVKPHTDYRGRFESGLMKHMVIGLGNQSGAEACHSRSMKNMAVNIETLGKILLDKANVIFGLAIVENAYDKTMVLEAIPRDNIWDEDPALLDKARVNMPSILLSPIDVLIVDEIGKNISGNGMDPNITGRFSSPNMSGGAEAQRCIVLDITDQSHGNGLGIGVADFSVTRAYEKYDFDMTYPNVITNINTMTGKLPVIVANDLQAIRIAIKTCNMIDFDNPKIIRLKNTLHMEYMYMSEGLLELANDNNNIDVLKGPFDFSFDNEGNIDFDVW